MIWDLFLLLMCLLWRPCKLRQTQIYDLSFPLTSNPIISFQRRLRSSSITTTLSVATPSSPHHGMTPPPLPIREENRERERERERERVINHLWVWILFWVCGGFSKFFCLKIDIFKFCSVLVCQENSRIFEKVAIIFFSQSSKWKNNFFFIFYFFELN